MAKVLVVDDEGLVGRMLVRRLRHLLGDTHAVLLASSAQEAFELVQNDVEIVSVVSDTEMPLHDGTWLHGKTHQILAERGGIFIPVSEGDQIWARSYYARYGLKMWRKLEIGQLIEQLTALTPKRG